MNRKSQQLFLYAIISILSFQFVFSGLERIYYGDYHLLVWGYTCTLIMLMGMLDIAIAIGLVIKPLRFISALILILSAFGQGYVYMMHEEILYVMVNTASGGLAFIVIWFNLDQLSRPLEG